MNEGKKTTLSYPNKSKNIETYEKYLKALENMNSVVTLNFLGDFKSIERFFKPVLLSSKYTSTLTVITMSYHNFEYLEQARTFRTLSEFNALRKVNIIESTKTKNPGKIGFYFHVLKFLKTMKRKDCTINTLYLYSIYKIKLMEQKRPKVTLYLCSLMSLYIEQEYQVLCSTAQLKEYAKVFYTNLEKATRHRKNKDKMKFSFFSESSDNFTLFCRQNLRNVKIHSKD